MQRVTRGPTDQRAPGVKLALRIAWQEVPERQERAARRPRGDVRLYGGRRAGAGVGHRVSSRTAPCRTPSRAPHRSRTAGLPAVWRTYSRTRRNPAVQARRRPARSWSGQFPAGTSPRAVTSAHKDLVGTAGRRPGMPGGGQAPRVAPAGGEPGVVRAEAEHGVRVGRLQAPYRHVLGTADAAARPGGSRSSGPGSEALEGGPERGQEAGGSVHPRPARMPGPRASVRPRLRAGRRARRTTRRSTRMSGAVGHHRPTPVASSITGSSHQFIRVCRVRDGAVDLPPVGLRERPGPDRPSRRGRPSPGGVAPAGSRGRGFQLRSTERTFRRCVPPAGRRAW